MEITIAKAMRYRNLLKQKLSEYVSLYHGMPKCHDRSVAVPDWTNWEGLCPEDVFCRIGYIEDILEALNLAINNKNLAAQNYLIQLNSLNDKKLRYENAIEEARRIPKATTEENRVTGEKFATYYEPDINIKALMGDLKSIQKEKFELETSLSDFNSSEKVDLSIPFCSSILGDVIKEIIEG
jgi:hypothetical protein